jgi:hypothetical protein
MSYTSAEQVRHHLVIPFPIEDQVRDQLVAMSGSDYVRFYGGAVDPESFRVKSIRSRKPTRSTVTFSNGSAVIAADSIVPDSAVVASDSSLGTVYVENVDYIVDYGNGTLAVKAGGVLSSNDHVTVWFLPYALYEASSDYSLDATHGRIKRLTGGDIAGGETTWLDYRPVYVSVTDEIVDNAVAMANGMIEREVDPEGEYEADSTLSAAATYRALEIVCRAAASRELASQRGADKVAAGWMKLSDDYATRSDLLLRNFRAPYSGPRAPVQG